MEQYLNVKVTTPRQVLYQGRALSVSSTNSKGHFDILPQHTNFITIIENKPIDIQEENTKKTFQFTQAIIYNFNNNVSIYAEPLIG